VCNAALSRGATLYCRQHAGRARQRHPASTPLAVFLFRKLSELGLTQAALASRVGVSRGAIGKYLRGTVPDDASLARLRSFFGEELPELGETASDRRRRALAAHNARLKEIASDQTTPEYADLQRRMKRMRARSSSGRGRKSPAKSASRKAWWAAQKERETDYVRTITERVGPAIAAYTKTTQGRVTLSIPKRDGLPLDAIKDHATAVGERYGLSSEIVMKIWRPHLRKRGYKFDGRPALDEEYRRVAALVDAWPTGKSGKWAAAAELRGRSRDDSESTRRWFLRRRSQLETA